ncbi:hypothetical protein U1Q18_049485 [Sarracenia purpurea var. burkii]
MSFLVGVILPKNNDKYPSFEKILQSLNIPQISYTDPQPGILDDIEVKNSHSSGSFSSVYSLSSGNIFMTDVIFEILRILTGHTWPWFILQSAFKYHARIQNGIKQSISFP